MTQTSTRPPGAALRADGRAADELRPSRINIGYQLAGEGSVLIEQGNTRVLCTASIENSQPPHLRGTNRGWVTAEYSMLPRAGVHRRAMRESVTGRRKGRTYEIERMIGRALRSVTNLDLLGPRTVYVDCDVLQADGGTRTSSVVGGFLALADALRKGTDSGKFPSLPVRAWLAAVSVGIVDGRHLMDLTFEEDSKATVDMNVVWTSDGRLTEVEAAGEGQSFSESDLSELLALSKSGAEKIFALQRQILPIDLPARAR